ncbi:MAG: ferredoxin [Candidatus Methanoperedens sp.]|nr:ferredoxin [Candidatus Methanoperedens sp.]
MTEKLRVSIDRKGCISCGTCWNGCPEFFEQNQKDACSQVIDKYRIASNPGEGEAPVEIEKMVRRAADLCPVQIIQIR